MRPPAKHQDLKFQQTLLLVEISPLPDDFNTVLKQIVHNEICN